VTKETAEKRRKFNEVRSRLHQLDVRFTLAYPLFMEGEKNEVRKSPRGNGLSGQGRDGKAELKNTCLTGRQRADEPHEQEVRYCIILSTVQDKSKSQWAGTCTDILGGRCSKQKKGHPMPKKNSNNWSISSITLMKLSSTCVSSGQHQTASLHVLYE